MTENQAFQTISPSKTILVVDDCRNFPQSSRDLIRTCRTSQDALDFMGVENGIRPMVDELWLDFDLGGVSGQLELFDTAMPIALHLAECAYYGNPYPVSEIIIHSSNPVGSEAMFQTLQRFGYNVRRQEAHFGV